MKAASPIPLPEEFLKRMQGQLGNQFKEFLEAMEDTVPVSIRLHPYKTANSYSFKLNDPVPWGQQAFYLSSRPVFTLDPIFHAGGYYVQEPSSMILETVVKMYLKDLMDPCILDLCASPGGKSTSILSQLGGRGLLVSNEIISSRVGGLQHNLIKWGFSNQLISQSDPARFKSMNGLFDLILVDAPCSGEGLFRKDAMSRLEWSDRNAHQCSLRQKRILSDVFDALKPGGIMIYSTCTYNPAENIDQVLFLQGLGMESLPGPELEKYHLVKVEKGGAIGFQAYPHKVSGEGLFLGILRKTAGKLTPQHRGPGPSIEWVNAPRGSEYWQPVDPGLSCFKHNDTYFIFPEHAGGLLEACSANLRISTAGCAFGQLKNKDFIPAHSWALNINFPETTDTLELDLTGAIRFLRKDNISNNQNKNGYLLVRYQGLNLGWVKSVQGRFNNLYPKNYRILMNG